jgi:Transposase DDE domain
VRLDLKGGTLEGPILAQGRWHDQKAAAGLSELPKGALRLADLGYFNLRDFAEMTQQGVYFLSRLKAETKLFAEAGQELDLPDALAKLDAPLDIPVELGAGQRLKVRLLGVKVPPEVSVQRRRRLKEKGRKKMRQPSKQQLSLCEWNLLITNAPASLVSVEEALVLARARWQIEMLFKLGKQQGQIDQWRSKKPWRILCEVYAKLVGMIIQHWMLLVSCWSNPDRSLLKGAQTVRSYAVLLATALAGLIQLEVVLAQIAGCVASGCRMNRRRGQPNTYQLLLALEPNP